VTTAPAPFAAVDEPPQPRARGAVTVSARRARGGDRLGALRQQGSARCFLPRTPGRLEAVLLNTAGGVTGGDRFDYAAAAEAGATLTVTTQAAERIYRARLAQDGVISTTLRLEAGATLHWLPQETILFDGARLDRRLEIVMAPDARLMAVEPLALGRLAMGETDPEVRLRDVWRVRRGGALIYADGLRLDGPPDDGAATLAGARAAAQLLYVAPDAADRLAALRDVLAHAPPRTIAGASAWNGMLAARWLAPDAATLRESLIPAIHCLRAGPPPRVWRL
jgi:urease accessory protein